MFPVRNKESKLMFCFCKIQSYGNICLSYTSNSMEMFLANPSGPFVNEAKKAIHIAAKHLLSANKSDKEL